MDHGDTLSQVAFILAIAFIGEMILRRLNQPALVGYILAGVLLGPSFLGVVHEEKQIAFLAEMGILLLLFIIGLELDLRNFARIYKIAIGTALVQIGTSLAICAVAGFVLDWPLVRTLLIAFAISLSSTAVAIRILESTGGIDTSYGRTAIGILVAQDLAVIPMLLIIGSFREGSFQPWDLLKIAFALGLMATIIITLSRRDFAIHPPAWLKDFFTGGNQTLVIKGLAICFSGAAISGGLGLSASYGAFLAGLLVGSTQDSKTIEHQARPIFDILMMVFFLSVGLMIDLAFLAAHLVPLLVMMAVIMVLKTSVTSAMLYRMGLPRRQALMMGTVLSQIGEFSFVLAGMGLAYGAIDMEDYRFAVTLIALSLICTPIWKSAMKRMIGVRRGIRRHPAYRRWWGIPPALEPAMAGAAPAGSAGAAIMGADTMGTDAMGTDTGETGAGNAAPGTKGRP